MNIADRIVSVLLDDVGTMSFDVRTRPDLYLPTGGKTQDGRMIVRVCSLCELEHGFDKKYPADVAPSHGYCRRHAIKQYMSMLGYSREQAEAKVSHDAPPDWNEVVGTPGNWFGLDPERQQAPAPKACVYPKATFWATSGSGAY